MTIILAVKCHLFLNILILNQTSGGVSVVGCVLLNMYD